jgi:glycosyltransferase involved in cell wall biosynthesis
VAKTSGIDSNVSSPLPDFAFKAIREQLKSILSINKYDLFLIGYVHWANLIDEVGHIPTAIMVEDCISVNLMERYGDRNDFDLEASLSDEVARINRFDTAIYISESERKMFSCKGAANRSFTIPHAVEINRFLHSKIDFDNREYDLVFVGSDNPFNLEAITWFLNNVWPLLDESYTLAIAGDVCEGVRKSNIKLVGVTLLGRVPSLSEVYFNSKVSICPMLHGTGLKIKIIEALSFGLPVISLPSGLMGLGSLNSSCIEAKDVSSFVESISLILSSFDNWKSRSISAFDLIEKEYSHLAVYSLFDEAFKSTVRFGKSSQQLSFIASLTESVKPRLTVVTVVMNMSELLERTIQSVISQNYPNLEYVVIDGGSTDGTLDIIKKYEDHIDIWVSESDSGIYDAMNKGTRLSSGVWINFLNAGDTFVSNSTVSDMFESVTINDDLVYGHTIFQHDGEERIVEACEPEYLWQAMIFNHNSLFVKRNLLLEHPFSMQYKIVADSEFVIWCYQNSRSFKNVGFPINTYETGGYADMNSVMRVVERWKLVSDYKLKPQQEINDFYFQRLIWEGSYKDYLTKTYQTNI